MHLPQFLLADFALAILFLSIALIFQTNKEKNSLFGILQNKKSEEQTMLKLPNSNKLLEYEIVARKYGSGIDFSSIIGLWKFESVWKQDSNFDDSLSSSLLKFFDASLALTKAHTSNGIREIEVTSSIQFAVLLIRFVGFGELTGSQPILTFYFEGIELIFRETLLYRRSIKKPDKKDMPFFGLIALGSNREWLAARGRGGGLALWRKA